MIPKHHIIPAIILSALFLVSARAFADKEYTVSIILFFNLIYHLKHTIIYYFNPENQ